MVTTRRRAYEPADSKPPKRRKTNENSASIRFTRACQICTADEPRSLFVLNPCGHAVCRACAFTLRWEASMRSRPVSCSVCRGKGAFVAMVEEFVADKNAAGVSGSTVDDASTGPGDPHRPRDREVAEEERITASEADRVLAEATSAWATYLDARGELLSACNAVVEALKKVKDLAIAASFAAEAVAAATAADVSRWRARLALLESACPMARASTNQEIARCEAVLSEQPIERLRAASEEAKAKREEAHAAVVPLMEVREAAKNKADESERKIEEQVKNLIERFQKENEDCATRGLHFSRACRACSTDSPPLRSFFPACGHVVCRECADRATASEADTKCPTCNNEGGAIPLFEEMTDN